MHHVTLYRARANDGNFDHEVVVTAWLQSRQHRHLCARFNLEDTHRVSITNHVVNKRVFGRHGGQAVVPSVVLPDQVKAAPNGGQHTKTQYVHFQKAEIFEVILFPLDHRAICHRSILNRHQGRQRPV